MAGLERLLVRSCATFDDEGASIEGLAPVNVIFGLNGTGKTTVSKVLEDPARCPGCQLDWELGQPLQVHVLNRGFRQRCVGETSVPGVYVVGEGNATAVTRIDELKEQIGQMEAQLQDEAAGSAAAHAALVEEWESFKDDVWVLKAGRKARRGEPAVAGYYEVFKPAFNKCATKDGFARKLLQVSGELGAGAGGSGGAAADGARGLPSESELLERAAILFSSEEPPRADDMRDAAAQATALVSGLAAVTADEVWGRPVVGNADLPIAALIEELGCADWVRRGAGYLRDDGVCPFCQQRTAGADLAAQIEAFFDGAYQEGVDAVSKNIERLKRAQGFAEHVAARARELGEGPVRVDYDAVAAVGSALTVEVGLALSQAERKLAEPGGKIELHDAVPAAETLVAALRELGVAAATYNDALGRRSAEAQRLVGDIWQFFASKMCDTVSGYRERARCLKLDEVAHKESAAGLTEAIEACRVEIARLSREVATTAAAAARVNETLAAHGVTGFALVEDAERPGCYRIERSGGGDAASTLSEGEEALLAFAYFMQLTQGAYDAASVGAAKLLVFDDPTTGMDAAAKSVVERMLAELSAEVEAGSGDVAQVIVLSHDEGLCRALLGDDPTAAAWTLTKTAAITDICEGLVGAQK